MRFKSIKARLQFFIIIILILLIAGFMFTYITGLNRRKLDSQLLSQQQLLSSIFDELEVVQQLLEKYIQSGAGEDYRNYIRAYPQLQEKAFLFHDYPRSRESTRFTTDFRYQVLTYLEEANAAVTARKSNQALIANEHFLETIKLVLIIKSDFQSVFRVLISDMKLLNERTEATNRQNLLFNIIVLVFAAVFCILIILEMMRSIARPIKRLTETAGNVTAGKWDSPPIVLPEDTDLRILTQAFNKMIETIRSQMEELSKSRILEKQLHEEEIKQQKMDSLIKESELKALQSRINPHFLFNTLNMISKMSYLEEAEKTTALIEAMSSMLRYNLDSFQKTVSLNDELMNLEDYLHIQRLRFEDRIIFSVKADPVSNAFELPSMILQPLVENSIIHGMKEKLEDGRIDVEVREIENKLLMSVKDNGCGIPYTRQDEIKKHIRQDQHYDEDGIGLFNVYNRLKLFFNGNVDFKISSIPGAGTEIIFILSPESAQ